MKLEGFGSRLMLPPDKCHCRDHAGNMGLELTLAALLEALD